jgi:hypothetical protein
MGARHGLQIVLRVPVRVKDDDRVGSRQIDPQPTRASGQQEGKVPGLWSVEVLHGLCGDTAQLTNDAGWPRYTPVTPTCNSWVSGLREFPVSPTVIAIIMLVCVVTTEQASEVEIHTAGG